MEDDSSAAAMQEAQLELEHGAQHHQRCMRQAAEMQLQLRSQQIGHLPRTQKLARHLRMLTQLRKHVD